jgi:hypothetical protein
VAQRFRAAQLNRERRTNIKDAAFFKRAFNTIQELI